MVAASEKTAPLPPNPGQLALRAVAMLPVWLALGNPAFYIPAMMKTVTLAQQILFPNRQTGGSELVLPP